MKDKDVLLPAIEQADFNFGQSPKYIFDVITAALGTRFIPLDQDQQQQQQGQGGLGGMMGGGGGGAGGAVAALGKVSFKGANNRKARPPKSLIFTLGQWPIISWL